MKAYVHFKLVVEVDEYEDADDLWEQAVDSLRDGGGDIIGHTMVDEKGNVVEEAP